MKTTIVLPTYNEAENLPLMIAALLGLNIPNLSILIVDDNSPDGTGELADALALKHAPYVNVYHNPNKGGLGPAYIAGFKRALADGADYIIQMDTDFSHQPRYIPELIAKADNGYDLVMGSRYVKGGGVDESWSWFRKLLSWFANRVYVSVVLGIPLTDATGGYRLWRRESLIGLDLDRIKASGYVFQVEMAYVAHKLGYNIAEITFYFPDRQRGTSKMGSHIIFEAAMRTFEIRQRHHALTASNRRTEMYSTPVLKQG